MREDVLDPLELSLGAELAGVRDELLQPPADELGDRRPIPPARLEIHQRRLEPVAGGQPLVLARQDPVERADLLAAVEPLAVHLHERLAVRGEGDGVLDPRDGVADADLDRAPPRMWPDVPPDVRVVRDAAGLLELADDLRVVAVVLEPGRRARSWKRGEDQLPRRGEAGRLPSPERRVRRQSEQRRQLEQQAVHDLDRLLGIVDRDVDVHSEDQLAAGDVLELVDERSVPVARSDPLPLEEAERVRPRRADPQ